MEFTRPFYLTLPSSSSLDTFPDNKAGHYRVRLPQRIRLSGDDWMVGLVQLDYVNTVFNITKEDRFYYDLNENGETFYRTGLLYPGSWLKMTDIANSMNQDIANGVYPQSNNEDFSKRLQFSFNDITKRMTARISDGASIYFTGYMGDMLGFEKNKILRKTEEAPYVSDLRLGKDALYVYTDLIARVPVGDVFAPLLRTVPLKGDYGESISENFENVHYTPVASNEFDTIEIDISFSSGQQVPFQSGQITCKLHFVRFSSLTTL